MKNRKKILVKKKRETKINISRRGIQVAKAVKKEKETRNSKDKLKRLKNYKTVCCCYFVYIMFTCPIL